MFGERESFPKIRGAASQRRPSEGAGQEKEKKYRTKINDGGVFELRGSKSGAQTLSLVPGNPVIMDSPCQVSQIQLPRPCLTL